MKICPACSHENPTPAMRCPKCGAYYSKIIELIDKEVAEEQQHTWSARYRRVAKSGNVRRAVILEIRHTMAGLPLRSKLVLGVIFIFVFALVFGF